MCFETHGEIKQGI